jgi:hypothetical protein
MKAEKSTLQFVLIRTVLLAMPFIGFCSEIFERNYTPSIGGNSGMSISSSLIFAAIFFLVEICIGINVLILLVQTNYKFAGIAFLVGVAFIGLYFLAIYINTLF